MSESFNCFPLAPENEFGPCVTPSRCTKRYLSGNSFVCSKHTKQCIDFLKYSSSSLKTPLATQYLQSYHQILLLPMCWCQSSFDLRLRNPECFWLNGILFLMRFQDVPGIPNQVPLSTQCALLFLLLDEIDHLLKFDFSSCLYGHRNTTLQLLLLHWTANFFYFSVSLDEFSLDQLPYTNPVH